MKKICSIKINNASFFDDNFSIEFSDKLNCIMGGRGTGKSTLLNFMQSSLAENSEETSTVSNILKANLQNGTINLIIQDDDGKKYEIIKTFGDEPQCYTLPNKRNISFDSLTGIFDCDIYPALSIEEIGKNSRDRLNLIDKKIRPEIQKFKSEIKSIQLSLKQNSSSIRTENSRIVQIKENLLNFKTVEDDLKRHKDEKPPEIKQQEQEEFEKADLNEKIRNSEKLFCDRIIKKFNETKSELKEIHDDISSFLLVYSKNEQFINSECIAKIRNETESILSSISKNLSANIHQINSATLIINKSIDDLKLKHQQQQNEFVVLKQRFDKYKEYINKYNLLSKKVAEKNILLKEIEELENKRKKIKSQRIALINSLNEKKKMLYSKRKEVVDELNLELDGSVKITLTFGGIIDEYENKLRNALRGSNLRYNAIIPYIVQSLTPDKFAFVIHDKDFDTLKNVAQIDEERSKAIIEALYESEEIYEIEGLYNEDLPDFFLKVDSKNDKNRKTKENYKKSDELSTGQRCTTVLPIIFAVSNNPLLIDQPEDNLDNKYITDSIHRIIREQKEKRQLIFITHNPNIPVLSDSEYNIFLNYDEKKSRIDDEGSIKDVKDSILNLLEGGKEAFEIRKDLYGND